MFTPLFLDSEHPQVTGQAVHTHAVLWTVPCTFTLTVIPGVFQADAFMGRTPKLLRTKFLVNAPRYPTNSDRESQQQLETAETKKDDLSSLHCNLSKQIMLLLRANINDIHSQ